MRLTSASGNYILYVYGICIMSLKPLPPPSGEPSDRGSYRMYLSGGMPVLRIAVEDLLSSGWSEAFRRRASEIACAFEGSFRCCGRADLAGLAHQITSLLELDYRSAGDLGPALSDKLNGLLVRLEALLDADEDAKTG